MNTDIAANWLAAIAANPLLIDTDRRTAALLLRGVTAWGPDVDRATFDNSVESLIDTGYVDVVSRVPLDHVPECAEDYGEEWAYGEYLLRPADHVTGAPISDAVVAWTWLPEVLHPYEYGGKTFQNVVFDPPRVIATWGRDDVSRWFTVFRSESMTDSELCAQHPVVQRLITDHGLVEVKRTHEDGGDGFPAEQIMYLAARA
jgi:hypothetical protein